MADFLGIPPEYWSSTTAQVVILLAGLAVMVAVGFYLVRRFRGGAEEDQPSASDLLTNFGELHSRGELSEQEYRTIKTLLAARMQEEIKDTGDKG